MTQGTLDRSAYREISEDLFASPLVSEQTAQAVKDKLKEMGKMRAEEVVAQYKLEVMFGTKHTVHGLAYGVLTIWENGTKLHGGGDSSLYICPGKQTKRNDCESIIPDNAMGLSVVMCTGCGVLWKREELFSEQFYRLPIQRWADVLLYWFLKTGMDADIRIKYSYQYKNMDIRKAANVEQERHLKGDFLNRVRDNQHRVARTYPLKNIIKDTSAGADLYTRILAFVRS